MRIAVLTVIAFSVFVLPVRAEDKVWYCEMMGLAETKIDGAETYKAQKFKMKITGDEVIFGSGGFFNQSRIPITFNAGGRVEAKKNTSTLVFSNKELHFAVASDEFALAISARCDDF